MGACLTLSVCACESIESDMATLSAALSPTKTLSSVSEKFLSALLRYIYPLFVNSDNFYENLKKLRLEDNFIVKSISTTLLNRVSHPNICPHYLSFHCFLVAWLSIFLQ